MRAQAALPFHIVSGFLGAGKTTLVNALLRDPALAGALVIVNEFGDVGLDHWLYENLEGEASLLASGCLCCRLRGDLADMLRDLLARRDAGALPPFSRIVVETSGLADPGPILHALVADRELARRLTLSGVVTLVDGVNGAATLEAHPEARRQVALADLVAITKRDLAGDVAALEARIREINPAAPIASGIDAKAFLEAPLVGPAAWRGTRFGAHGGGARAVSFLEPRPLDEAALSRVFLVLERLAGPKLLRVKGLALTARDPRLPLVIEGAQHVVHAPRLLSHWPYDPPETRLVVIADGMAAADLDRFRSALSGLPEIDRPDMAALLDNPLAPRGGGLLG